MIVYSRTAEHIDMILKGWNSSELSVVQPTKLELVINLNECESEVTGACWIDQAPDD